MRVSVRPGQVLTPPEVKHMLHASKKDILIELDGEEEFDEKSGHTL